VFIVQILIKLHETEVILVWVINMVNFFLNHDELTLRLINLLSIQTVLGKQLDYIEA
jgi:hypothetical protein